MHFTCMKEIYWDIFSWKWNKFGINGKNSYQLRFLENKCVIFHEWKEYLLYRFIERRTCAYMKVNNSYIAKKGMRVKYTKQ